MEKRGDAWEGRTMAQAMTTEGFLTSTDGDSKCFDMIWAAKNEGSTWLNQQKALGFDPEFIVFFPICELGMDTGRDYDSHRKSQDGNYTQ